MINLRRIVEVTHVFDAISGGVNFRSKFRTFFRTLAFLSRDRENYRVLINLAYHGTYYERGTESLFNSRERNRNTCVSVLCMGSVTQTPVIAQVENVNLNRQQTRRVSKGQRVVFVRMKED